VYGDTGVIKVETPMGSIYWADSGVDSHHLISISCNHTMIIHTLSFPTFCLICTVRNIVDARNCLKSSMPGSSISSHPISRLLEQYPDYLLNSLGMS
jgi:hypothetical protein